VENVLLACGGIKKLAEKMLREKSVAKNKKGSSGDQGKRGEKKKEEIAKKIKTGKGSKGGDGGWWRKREGPEAGKQQVGYSQHRISEFKGRRA